MEVIRIELKQHTPLIHFQPNEPGATLRASEVKPRLDKFIIAKVGGGDYENVRESNKDWFIPKDNVYALNYKMRIEAETSRHIYIGYNGTKLKDGTIKHFLENFPLILSNMTGKPDKDTLANFSFHSRVAITVIAGNDGLANEIINRVREFFDTNNFGQRNDKGFGSFTVTSIKKNGKDVKMDNEQGHYKGVPYISFSYDKKVAEVNKEDLLCIFNVIDYYWKRLKSGINYTTRLVEKNGIKRINTVKHDLQEYELYHKSYLFKYLKDKMVETEHGKKSLTWEKRKIKQKLELESARLNGDPQIVENGAVSFFARAHLGCPTSNIIYRIATGKIKYDEKKKRKIEEFKTVVVKVSNNKDIERIPSPIIFKPVISSSPDGETTIVTIYLLLNKAVLGSIQKLSEDTAFKFIGNGKAVYLPLFPSQKKFTFDYYALINSFHEDCGYKLTVLDGGKNIIQKEVSLSK